LKHILGTGLLAERKPGEPIVAQDDLFHVGPALSLLY
jgi:hypothetical protein